MNRKTFCQKIVSMEPSLTPLDEILEIQNDVINTIARNINEAMEEELRKNCVPPISGKLTRGKVVWRGIRRIQNADGSVYLTQRGKRISKTYIINVTHEP